MKKYSGLTEKHKELVYQAIFTENSELKFLIDREGTILDANNAFCERMGVEPSACSGANVFSLLPSTMVASRKRHIDEAFRTGKTQIFEDERNGRYFNNILQPIGVDNEQVAALYIRAQDITDIRLAELKSKKNAAFTQQAMEAHPGPFTVLDVQGKLIASNSYFRNLVGKSEHSDLFGLDTFELFHPKDKPLAYNTVRELLENDGEATLDLRVRLHGGAQYRWFRISTKLLVIDNERFLVCSGMDIDDYKKTEQQLSFSNEQLRFILSESKVGSWQWDVTTNTNTWSDEIWELYGLEPEACPPSYECWKNIIIEEDRDKSERVVREALANASPFKDEWRVRHPDGSLHWLMSHGTPFKNSRGEVASYIGIVVDVTELKETEQKLKASEERFRKLFEDHSSAIVIIDAESNQIINANKAATEFYGWSSDVMSGMSIDDIAIMYKEPSVDEMPSKQNEKKRLFSAVHRRADGSHRDVEAYCSISTLSEKVVYFCIINDVTERNAAKRESFRNKIILNAALESMSDSVFIIGAEGSFIKFNDAFATFHRFSNKEECQKTLEEYRQLFALSKPDGSPATFEEWPVCKALRGEKGLAVEYGLRRIDTGEEWIGSYNFAPIRNPKGDIIGSVVTARDITHQKDAENALRQSEERFRNFFEKHSAVMMILDPASGEIVDVNNAAEEFYGWSKEELRSMNIMEINVLKREESRKILDKWNKVNKRTFTITHRKADGTSADIEVFGKKIAVKGKGLAFLILHDITEQKKFQQALLESNERVHYILDAANAGMWETDIKSHASAWSDELWTLYGIEPNSCKPSLETWLNTIIAEDRPAVERTITEAVEHTTEFNDSWRVMDADGSIRWLMCKGNPVKDSSGKAVKYAGITLDITARKRAEEDNDKLEARVRRSERIETLGNLAGGIAHDFNNILTPILGYAEMGAMELPEKEPSHEYFKQITLAAERAQNLVYQILTFSKASETESSSVKLQSIIDEALKLLRPSIPSTIKIEKHLNPSCRAILADPSRIYQVILNLCTNAYQAMEENGGTLSIELDEVRADKALIKKFPELEMRPYVKLTIADTGYGMDNKTIDRIFEPFFTTKSVNKGTGLGLSVVHGIITSYKGIINVESQPGKGAAFQIYLPVSQEAMSVSVCQKVDSNKTANILLVDDEAQILEMMSIMLEQAGHTVQSAQSPLKALERCQQAPQEFDLVMTDLTMPGITGLKLASELYKACPTLPVILMTGYEKSIDSYGKKQKNNIIRILKKPIRFDTLIASINEAMAGRKAT